MNLKKFKNIELFLSLIVLNTISLLNMINAKKISSNYDNYFFKQLIWFILGYIIIIIIYKINLKKIFNYSKYFYSISIILLLLVLFIGKSINGAKCWINFFGISFQPSELCKLSLSLYLIFIINENKFKNLINELKLIIKILIITIIPSILVFLEPDTGAIIYFFIIAIILFGSIKLNKYWYLIFTILFSVIIIFFLYYLFFNQDFLIKIIGNSLYYRIDRLINFANGNSYQLENSLITIGSSSFFGEGLNRILVYIPEATTDFLFAFNIGNFGIFSCIIIIISLFMFDSFLIDSKKSLKNKSYKLFIATYTGIIIFQQLYNILMNIGLLPIMGIPLPFLSYGGSNIIINYTYIGLILNMIKSK